MEEFERLLGPRTQIVAVAHVSNALGTINPVRRMIELAHAQGAVVLVDGAQAAPHLADRRARARLRLLRPLRPQALRAHRASACSTARQALLEAMPPYQGGGDMILSVTFEKTTYNELPYKFEAGTPEHRGRDRLRGGPRLRDRDRPRPHRRPRARPARRTRPSGCSEVPGLRIIGTAPDKAAVVSFVLEGVHPHDIGTVLDYEGVAVRTGHHCAQPVMDRFGLPATARASMAVYNTRDEIDVLVRGLRARCGRCSSDVAPARAVPGGDPGPQPQAAELRRAARGHPPGRRLQPAVRRPGHGVRAPGRRRGRGRELPGRGLLDLHRLGLDDDGEREGQDAARRRRRCSSASTSLVTRDSAAPRREVDPELGKLAVFSGVCEFPVRVKCASLPWHTLKAALEGDDRPVSTEVSESSSGDAGGHAR